MTAPDETGTLGERVAKAFYNVGSVSTPRATNLASLVDRLASRREAPRPPLRPREGVGGEAVTDKDKFGWPVRMVGDRRVCARPACASVEFRIDGYCSHLCEEDHDWERRVSAARAEGWNEAIAAAVASLNALAESESEQAYVARGFWHSAANHIASLGEKP